MNIYKMFIPHLGDQIHIYDMLQKEYKRQTLKNCNSHYLRNSSWCNTPQNIHMHTTPLSQLGHWHADSHLPPCVTHNILFCTFSFPLCSRYPHGETLLCQPAFLPLCCLHGVEKGGYSLNLINEACMTWTPNSGWSTFLLYIMTACGCCISHCYI